MNPYHYTVRLWNGNRKLSADPVMLLRCVLFLSLSLSLSHSRCSYFTQYIEIWIWLIDASGCVHLKQRNGEMKEEEKQGFGRMVQKPFCKPTLDLIWMMIKKERKSRFMLFLNLTCNDPSLLYWVCVCFSPFLTIMHHVVEMSNQASSDYHFSNLVDRTIFREMSRYDKVVLDGTCFRRILPNTILYSIHLALCFDLFLRNN